MNIATIIGRVGKDPEIFYTSAGDPIAKFSVATSERWKDKSGQKQERTEWHRVTAFAPVSKVVRDYVKKGDQIAISGKIHYDKYEKDGVTKYSTEIQVGGFGTSLELLGGKKSDGAAPEQTAGEFQASDDDVPF